MDDTSSSGWAVLAEQHWTKSVPSKVNPSVLRDEIWIPLESSGFATHALLPLENLQVLERYLWPTFTDASSNQHVILITAFVNLKRQANLDPWPIFQDRSADFSALFRRILSLCLDTSLPILSKISTLNFVIAAFQSLEKDWVRKECAPLVSISTWHNLNSDACRNKELQKDVARQKAWRSAQKKFDNADNLTQVKLRFDRAWLYSMVLDFCRRISSRQNIGVSELRYLESFLEFLTDLISQLPTRRYTIVLLRDLNVAPLLKTSNLVSKGEHNSLYDLAGLYEHFADLRVDESGTHDNVASERDSYYADVAQLQRTALRHFGEKLKVLALSNHASINSSQDLQSQLSPLSDVELEELCNLLGFRTTYPASSGIITGRPFFLQVLSSAYSRQSDFRQVIQQTAVVPTEESLYDDVLLRNETYDDSKPLALPKLNLQYLSLDDFMWRSFQLHQAEAFYEIRKDMENIVRRMKPKPTRDSRGVKFEGFSKMGMPIEKPAVIESGQANIGHKVPSFVRAEVILDVSRLNDRILTEWDTLRPKDTVFLLGVQAVDAVGSSANGKRQTATADSAHIAVLRTAEIVQVLDDKGKQLRNITNGNTFSTGGRKRRFLLDLDPIAFHRDQERLSHGKPDVWASINMLARRQGRENNFKPVLETIQRQVGVDTNLPSWLRDVYLGYGDPKAASYPNIASRLDQLDFLDTFLDWPHLQESLPSQVVVTDDGQEILRPPYVLRLPKAEDATALANPRKRRRAQMEAEEATPNSVRVSTYKPLNTGPYQMDTLKRNIIRFTPKQVEAIISGTQPGISLVVGPPGTGKTDIATQIINLLYHNFPSERILLIAHSNQALNQLFQKIIALDIDPRHLLRLGHGEEELESETSYSKAGRVESFMDNRQAFLSEVTRLAASIDAAGAHGSSCETADYFNQVFVRPAWSRFWTVADEGETTPEQIIKVFPFKKYFSTAPVPELLPETASVEELREISKGCQYHLDKIFQELESIRPFEILRHPRDQANHLLVKEARVIAMTSTHAAIRKSEIADLGFHYDTLIMEEAAQVTEMESFIPCVMQNPDSRTGETQLKRIVLVGDHLQNSPVVQNLALRQYANLEQSLFLRLVRLGVPTTTLDQQGRCRPSIAELFSWRYENLTDLPHLTSLPEFQRANAGFRHEFQFIDVPDYQDQGEREPTPHFIQNLGEAEYAVALYQYMRLLGYPARSITILATYAGQKALIRDVLEHRCKGNRLFGMPRIVATVDKYQGEQNDYIILSLVRTKTVGYLRDLRRLTVALSRARLGLYILGRKDLFEGCLEMQIPMKILNTRGNQDAKLELVTGEMFPTTRLVGDSSASVIMDGVEHLGQYVYEMTQAMIKDLGGKANLMIASGSTTDEPLDEEAEKELAEEADLEEDPLHETV